MSNILHLTILDEHLCHTDIINYTADLLTSGILTLGGENFIKYIEQAQFFMGWFNDAQAHIDDEGNFNYPGDPTLKPVAKFTFGPCEAYCYRYSWVAARNSPADEFKLVRLD